MPLLCCKTQRWHFCIYQQRSLSLSLFIVPLSVDTSSANLMSNTALVLTLTIGNPLTQLSLASHPSTYSFQLD